MPSYLFLVWNNLNFGQCLKLSDSDGITGGGGGVKSQVF